MSDFLNPLGGRFIGSSSPVAPSAVTGTVPDPPRALQQLDPGTIIKGIVMGRESDGLTAIATDKGTIRVASNALLPAGAHVTLEVRPAGDRLQVLILSNDAAPRAGGHNTSAPQIQQPTPGQTAPGPTSLSGQPATSGGPSAASPETRGQTPQVTPAPARVDQPGIQIIGSSLRAVVVQAAPPPDTPPAPPPPPQQASAPQAPAPVPPPIPAQAQTPQSPAPQAPPPELPAPQIPAGQAQPASAPSAPPPPAPPPPAPVLMPPNTAVEPLPTQPPLTTTAPPIGPTGAQPVPTTPVPTVPVPIVAAPAPTTLPTQPMPPQGMPIPAAIGPTTLMASTAAAMMQAALIAATAERKDRPDHPPAATSTIPAAGAISATAAVSTPETSLSDHHGQAASPDLQLSTSLLSQVPTGTALSADARLRILALFASAPTTAGEGEIAPPDTEAAHVIQPAPDKIPAASAQPLPIGAELKLRVLAVQMQAHQPIEFDLISADPHDPHAQVIFGRVVGMTPAGHAVIHTPVGDIMLQNRSSLPLGAKLALAIDTLETAPPPAAMAMPMVQTPQQALFSLAQSWPTLADLIAVFQGAPGLNAKPGAVDPETAKQALAMLPRAGNKLGAGMMNAMAALRAGDIGKLLGPLFAAKGAGSEREELVRRLRGEFSQLSTLAQERPDVDWRALFLPIIDDQGRVTQVNLFYRRPKKGETEDRAGGTGTRFVVEADFSRLGAFQLDGLMRQQRFDLMVRSRARLTDRMRRDIEAIYEEARGLTGFAGSIAFQTVADFPVIPLDDLKRGSPKVTA